MARSRKASDALPLDKLMRHHRAAWRVERIAWAVIALSLLAAVLGVFGDGPLSSTRAGESTSLSVEYERLLRSAAPTEYRFDASRIVISDGALRLRFDQALIDDIEIDTVVPEPVAVTSGAGYTEFAFDVAPGERPARITFHFRPTTFGHREGHITADGAPPLAINHYIYP